MSAVLKLARVATEGNKLEDNKSIIFALVLISPSGVRRYIIKLLTPLKTKFFHEKKTKDPQEATRLKISKTHNKTPRQIKLIKVIFI